MKQTLSKILGFFASLSFMPNKLRDLILWPLASRVLGLGYKQEVLMKDGFKMMGSMEDILSREILFLGPYKQNLWEPKTSALLVELSKTSSEILIAGAHMGYLVLLSALNTKGRVHTFEPIPHLFKRLEENIKLNPNLKDKICVNKEALGEKTGEFEIYSEDIRSSFIPYGGGHIKNNNKIVVPVMTIDEYALKIGVGKFDLILLDIEGFEWFALNGAKMVLEHKPDLILEISPKILAHTEVTKEMIFGRLHEMGYKTTYLDQDKDYANIYATIR